MDTLVIALRVALSLGVVLALLWVLQRRLAKGGAAGGGKGRRRAAGVTVVARQGIGGKASVVVVDVEGDRLVLGVTEGQVSLLARSDVPAPTLELVTPLASAPLASPDEAPAHEIAAQETVAPAPIIVTERTVRGPRRRATHVPVATQQQLQGSILSADTWRQAAAAIRTKRAG